MAPGQTGEARPVPVPNTAVNLPGDLVSTVLARARERQDAGQPLIFGSVYVHFRSSLDFIKSRFDNQKNSF